MRKPRIRVMPLYDAGKESFRMLHGYFGGIQNAIWIRLMLLFLRNAEDFGTALEQFDGFFLTNGYDVSPALYGKAPLAECGEICKRAR